MKSNSLKFIIIVLILQLSIKDQAIAQSGQNDTIVADEVIYNFLDISFDFNYPQGFFKENTEPFAPGVSIAISRQLKVNSPFTFGLMFSYIDLEDLTGDYIDTNGGFDLEVDQHAYTNIYDLNARMKYYTPIAFWRFENYVIGALGYRAIVASYSDSYTTDTEYTDVEIEKWSSSMTYLIGTGFVFHLKNKTFLHFEGSMKNGGISRYLSIEDLGNELPKDNFKIKSSQSDIFALSLGLSFVF